MIPAARHNRPQRVARPLFTPGILTLMIFMGVGFSFGITRLLLGLGSVTNLNDRNPWGIWIAFDVACGVALAAGGFTTAALVEIFGRRRYRPLLRPALLTAFLGYLWVAVALIFDLGRYWNIWRPIFSWQGNSVLFEVGMCVVFYLLVLAVEISPSILEGLKSRIDRSEPGAGILRRVERPIVVLHAWAGLVMPLFVAAGVVLSFMHQSSLGTLMLIAPTKLSPLWHTPILPVLFLLSAIMVGFPMVIVESLYAGISLGRRPEMHLLTPLARIIPVLLGCYGVVKIGDLVVRRGDLDFYSDPAATVSLAVEILLGVAIPFLLLLHKAVRRSAGWLFFSVSLIVFGVILNRINVYLVGYNPPYATRAYFPSVGEIALTIAIVCGLLFCYRLFVTFFPFLPGTEPAVEARPALMHPEPGEAVRPSWVWIVRGSAAAVLAVFVAVYSLVHTQAIRASARTVNQVERIRTQARAQAVSAPSAAYPLRPSSYKNLYWLDSPLLRAASDDYEPVAFAHRIHDNLTGGDCGVCHHRHAGSDGDRVGEDIGSLHALMDIKLGGPCATCHEDMAQNPPQGCARCHGAPNEDDAPSRIGLKGAYHRQCIGCHQRRIVPEPAPTECNSCHHPWTPDHSLLVTLPAKPAPQDVTRNCLSCHAKAGQDVLKTAHWNWKGHSRTLVGSEYRTDIGLQTVVDNYCIAMGPNIQQCSSCHIGYGKLGAGFDYNDPQNIDCLVCHDTTGTYKKDPDNAGLPYAELDLSTIARKVGRPSRSNCGSCHFASGGALNAKHGDLEPELAHAPEGLDVHMGMLNMRCQDCHSTAEHKIAGASLSAPAVEGRVACEKCHGSAPHGVSGVLSRHLDDHVRAIACETCHIPSYARRSPTLLKRDYSAAGQDRAASANSFGLPEYDKRFGALTWGKDLVPVYLWYDGTRRAALAGDTIDPSSPVVLNSPVGEKRNPAARIFPFKAHTAVQPYDIEKKVLALPKLVEGFWAHFDWGRAIAEGMKLMGLEYSGKYGFIETIMYSGIHHTVAPADKALGCSDCHAPQAVSCIRCHKNARELDLPRHRRAVYPEVKQRLDFKTLGYADDPALIGGRFYVRLGRGTPPR